MDNTAESKKAAKTAGEEEPEGAGGGEFWEVVGPLAVGDDAGEGAQSAGVNGVGETRGGFVEVEGVVGELTAMDNTAESKKAAKTAGEEEPEGAGGGEFWEVVGPLAVGDDAGEGAQSAGVNGVGETRGGFVEVEGVVGEVGEEPG
ncbi:hypothetical protein TIFTF001_056546, partial [Ficus carica]